MTVESNCSGGPSPKRRKRATPSPSTIPASLNHLLQTDLSLCDPTYLTSVLFRLEFDTHGSLTYQQSHSRKYQPRPAPSPRFPPPSWSESDANVRALGPRLNGESFVANVLARDLVGDNKDKRVRKAVVKGLDMYLLGREYPLRSVCVVGLLVANEEKENKWLFHVDDGTAIVTCVVPTESDKPYLPSPKKAPTSSPPASPSKERSHQDQATPLFSNGQLVRVMGRLSEGAYQGADRVIQVDRMHVLTSHEDEFAHHLAVKELHRTVYSKHFDLASRLAEEDQTQAMWEPCSQAGSEVPSESGTPEKPKVSSSSSSSRRAMVEGGRGREEKRIKLPHPNALGREDLTVRTFKAYVLRTVTEKRRAQLKAAAVTNNNAKDTSDTSILTAYSLLDASSTTFTSSAAASISHSHNSILTDFFGSTRPQSLSPSAELKPSSPPPPPPPESFTLASLLNSKTLNLVASRGGAGSAAANEGSWVSGSVESGTLLRPWRGGSAKLLPPPMRGKGKETKPEGGGGVGEKEGEEGERDLLEGVELEKAKRRVFVDALREMRKEGVIVLGLTAGEKSRDKGLTMDEEEEMSRQRGNELRKRRVENSQIGRGGGGWLLREPSSDVDEDEERTPRQRLSRKRDEGNLSLSSRTFKSESLLKGPSSDAEVPVTNKSKAGWKLRDFEGEEGIEKSLRRSRAKPRDELVPSKKSSTGWDLRGVHDSSDVEVTPQKPRLSFNHNAPDFDDATPKATSKRPSSTTTAAVASTAQEKTRANRIDRGTGGASSRPASRDGSSLTTTTDKDADETFDLVTVELLSPLLLTLLPVGRGAAACDESAVRSRLANDERWEAVARKSSVVGKALQSLRLEGEVEKTKEGKWRRSAGFGR